jgi:hypothetical protein
MRTSITGTAVLVAIVLIHSAEAQTVAIRAADCAQLVRHVTAANVAFDPGLDLQGRPVAPADLDGGVKIELPGEFSIPITVDLQKSFGIPVDPNLFQTQNFTVGVVTWEKGKGYFNGQPLQSEQSAKLAALCQKQMAKGG